MSEKNHVVYVYLPFNRVWAEEHPLRFSWIKEYMFIYLQTDYEMHWILRIFYRIFWISIFNTCSYGKLFTGVSPVWYQAVQCVQKAPSPKEHSLLKYFFFISFSVVILNSSLHYQIFKFDIDIFRNWFFSEISGYAAQPQVLLGGMSAHVWRNKLARNFY